MNGFDHSGGGDVAVKAEEECAAGSASASAAGFDGSESFGGEVAKEVEEVETSDRSAGLVLAARKGVRVSDAHDVFVFDSDASPTPHAVADLAVASGGRVAQETPDYIRREVARHRIIRHFELYSHGAMLDSSPVSVEAGGGVMLLGINAGGVESGVNFRGSEFQPDGFYTGGDTFAIKEVAEAVVDGLYRSVRVGNFSYKFSGLKPGKYLVDLHFAEIILTDGPPGARIFDVFIQDEKVVAGLDVFAEVGANWPLVISDQVVSVRAGEPLVVRFEGVVGQPIVSGITIRRIDPSGMEDNLPPDERKEEALSKEEDCKSCHNLRQEYSLLMRAQEQSRRLIEDLKRENDTKSKKCRESEMSLQQLMSELTRKSMHVGSLAFAVEGQVKEKARWLQALSNMTVKFELLKMEHAKLSEESHAYKNCLTDIVNVTFTIQRSIDSYKRIERDYKELKQRFLEESRERRDLYNKLIALKGNIRVFCRCRPLNAEEIAEGASMAVDFESARDGEIIVKAHLSSRKVFRFDSVFSPEEDQEKVFERTAPLATSVLDGYNVCIFAYGQTGTGKTFTMEGTEDARGVNYRTLAEIFRIIDERQGFFRYEVTVSVLEVYNEQINDLLLNETQPAAAKRLEVRQVADGEHHVPGLTEARVNDIGEVWDVLKTGSKARAVGSTNANEHSSRSHCIHCVMVRGENLMNGECTKSKLWLIDLAGSERVAKTDAQGDRLKEAQNINKSLSALGDVISALATKSSHVPFRNSKLTHLLQDSLSGDSKTLMFVQVSPSWNDVGETLCSLNFASRVRGIELGPAKKQVDAGELAKYKMMVVKAKQESKNRDLQVKCLEESVQNLEMKNKAKELLNINLQEKIKELESQLLIERKLARQHVDTKIAQEHQQQMSINDAYHRTPPPANLNPDAYHALGAKEVTPTAPLPLSELTGQWPPATSPFIDGRRFTPQPVGFSDKENRPDSTVRRFSLYGTGTPNKNVSSALSARRQSLIPPPRHILQLPLPPMTIATTASSPPLTAGPSRIVKARSNRISSILRRSVQKKVVIRPHAAGVRRVAGDNQGTAASGSRKVRRVAAADNGDRTAIGQRQHKQQLQQQQKQRGGWNNY